jgi:hypothetical protein
MKKESKVAEAPKEVRKADSPDTDGATVANNLSTPIFYVYYLRITNDPEAHTAVYCVDLRTPVPPGHAEGVIKSIAGDIEAGAYQQCGWKIGDVRWRRRSWMVFLLEDPNETLTTVSFNPAHAFLGGKTISEFTSPAGKRLTGYYCTNHMKKMNGNDVDAVGERIRVHAVHSAAPPPIVNFFSHEDTGTNMGPPIGSP